MRVVRSWVWLEGLGFRGCPVREAWSEGLRRGGSLLIGLGLGFTIYGARCSNYVGMSGFSSFSFSVYRVQAG